jgi:filamentous hemagglutinin family protein
VLEQIKMKKTQLLLTLPWYCLIVNNWIPAQAQISPDGSLSTNVTTENNLNFTINDGNRAGNNLFHSFREFSVPTGGEAFFNNAADIQNIFSRVTGGSVSQIDGLIRANRRANLFLLNPSGIIFGPNARLNIGGSFFASTARSLIFSDGTQFSATNNQTPPLLTINIPVGLQYGSKAEPIRVQGSKQIATVTTTKGFDSNLNILEVKPGNTLAILGGNVIIDGGILQAPGGRIEVGGLAGEGTIAINQDGSLSFPAGGQRADVSMINKAGINVLAGGSGHIAINAQNLEISDSLLTTGIATGLGTQGAQSGNILIDATKAITITASRIENNINPASDTQPAAIGDGGDIIIQAGSTLTTDTASLSTGTFGQGNGGNLIITANSVALTNGTLVDSFTSGLGNAGNIAINSKDNVVIVESKLQSDIFKAPLGGGNAGNIFVQANGLVTIFNSEITSTVPEKAAGNGGTITIEAGAISLMQNTPTGLRTTTSGDGKAGNIILTAKDGIDITSSAISSDTFGAGNAGIVEIKAGGAIAINKTDINSQVKANSTGNGGIIYIEGKSVSLTDNTRVETSIENGKGNAGIISINARDAITITGSNIESSATSGATGDAGKLSITSGGSISISDNTFLESSNFVGGNAGSVVLDASDQLSIINSKIFSDTFNDEISFGGGLAGIISFTAGNGVYIVNSQITAESFGGLDGNVNNSGLGIIEINGKDVTLDSSELSTSTKGASVAGSINIKANSLSIIDASTVGSSSFGTGDSGNVTINATGIVAIDNSKVLTNAASFEGDAGDIAIAAQSIQLTNGAALQSSNFFGGNAGNITVKSTENISISNGNIFSDTYNDIEDESGGFAGNIFIKAGNSLLLDSSSQITAESLAKLAINLSLNPLGLGFISVEAKAISLSGQSRLSTSTYGVSAGGDINIQTQTLFVAGGSRIEAVTYGIGKAGNIAVNASESIALSGVAPLSFDEKGNILGGNSSGLFADTNQAKSGAGGNIVVNTNKLQITDGSVIAATTRSIEPGGNIAVKVNNLQLTGGGQILASAFNTGSAGSVTVIAQDRITISGSDPTYQQRFDTISQKFNPVLANLIIDQDGPDSGLFVNNRGAGQGGDINVIARSILLDNGAAITAQTASGNGGNIGLEARDLILLRRHSDISTSAGSKGAGGDGGNITISTPNLVALENSDITANAFEGRGGRVSITAQGIFGTQARTEETPNSDITAISQIGGPELSGTVELNTPDVDPSSGLIELPQTVVDITGLIDRRCSPEAQESSFIATGRGGLPPSPTEPLNDNAYLVDLVDINSERQESRRAGEQPRRKESAQITEIVEAQGWIINEKGQVVLVANPPNLTPHRSGIIPIQCHVR